jgi:uncharacterized membrane protein
MEHIYFDSTGFMHLLSSIVAVFFGTLSLIFNKGSKLHKLIGYVYTISMIVLLVTAFMIYRLFDGFGIFHFTAIVSSLTLIAGLYPALFMRENPKWLYWHSGFMYWSVIGLYGAFVAEMMVRIPNAPFYSMVGIAVGVVMIIGAYFYIKKSKDWETINK